MYVFRYCPDCGASLGQPELPTERVVSQSCSACRAVHFRNAKPCAGALVVRDGRVLLGRRAVEPARGCWDIPGGFLNPWEHPADAAVREVAEETGLRVRVIQLLTMVIDTYQERDYTFNVYYLAAVAGGREQPTDDLAELRWFGPAELPHEFAFPHCRQVLAAWRNSVKEAATGIDRDLSDPLDGQNHGRRKRQQRPDVAPIASMDRQPRWPAPRVRKLRPAVDDRGSRAVADRHRRAPGPSARSHRRRAPSGDDHGIAFRVTSWLPRARGSLGRLATRRRKPSPQPYDGAL